MKTEQIALALAIVREGSISKAAESLFISQPTASNMLKALETELGYPLFSRTRAGMLPTSEGAEFIGYAGAIERSLDGIAQIGHTAKRVDFGVLSCQFDFAELAFEKLCENYLGDGFVTTLSYLIEPNTQTATRMVENGNADVAVVLYKKSLNEIVLRDGKERGLEITPIGECPLMLTCNKDHPAIAGESIAYDLLDEYTGFASVRPSDSETYAPRSIAEHGPTVQNSIITNPCAARYRLLRKTNGFLVSTPIPDEVKAEYDLVSLPIENASVCASTVFRIDSQKKELIDEYIQNCRSLF